ncbi:leucyl aminopeptidase family protein [Thalassolituus sp. UBA3500]|uniref:leucyl aminopeptidase family protein n=1 Tax=Thalassolituus sp. UBA3500 TaxID=1947664 RepID=UPI00263ABED5|nr:leucyl aminopeptidase family protein [Thalassolituus sp. UBA3500]|tara:strand:- start:6516 stop:7883 length:1368 start_codon:yes stop_codon:yes gene_type:complete
MMSAVLMHSQEGTPLHLIEKEHYANWLDDQPEYVKQWLLHSGYAGSGHTVIPSSSGSIDSVLCVVESTEDFFVCGNLSSALPAGTYTPVSELSDESLLALAFGWGVGAYRFDRYTEKPAATAKLALNNEAVIEEAGRLIEGTKRVRDLINTPASDMMPQNISSAVHSLADEFGAKVRDVVGSELLEQNYPMIHAVGRASEHDPRLIDLTWGNQDHPKVTLVGKGICFDSGGLNMKPGDSMRLMKKDMGGAAHTIGLAYLIMANKLPVRLRLLIPAAENAVSGNAFRPGDVIPTRKGLTVEIDNTDAEGRLVLCDALFEGASEKPDLMIDFATLTGACRVALGTDLPGFFTNQKQLAGDLMQAGEKVSDPVWNLPLFRMYKEALHSEVADMVNSVPGPFGGAITAALYLEAFVEETPWVHFDVMAWNRRALRGKPVGGEAMGMRAMFEYLRQRYPG